MVFVTPMVRQLLRNSTNILIRSFANATTAQTHEKQTHFGFEQVTESEKDKKGKT